MKLRTRRGSLRLRLTRREVETLAADGRIVESLVLAPGMHLSWSVVTSESATTLRATIADGALVVTAPRAWVVAWSADEARVGLEAVQEDGPHRTTLLVEKDWACLKPREGEDDADAYPHPAAPHATRST